MATEKLYWEDPFAHAFEARLVAVSMHGDAPSLVLDRTLFYPEGGGQLGDRGTLVIAGRSLDVKDVQVDDDGAIHHLVEVLPELEIGVTLQGTIERARRRDHMSQHTAQHVLSRALVDVARAETVSARLGAGTCTIDVKSLDPKGTVEEAAVARAEDVVNELVMEDVLVRTMFPTPDELATMPLRRQPKVQTGVRVVEVEGFDLTPCGGTHTHRTGQIGPIKVLGLEKYKGGTRVTFVAGKRAFDDLRARDAVLRELGRAFTCGPNDVPSAVAKLRADLKIRTDAFASARGELMQLLAEQLLARRAPEAGGTRIVVVREGDDLPTLRALAAALARRPDVIAIVGARDPSGELLVVVERGSAVVGFDAGGWLKSTAAAHGGRGGGRPERAEGRLAGSIDLESVASALTG